ncbi:MAG: YceD family protein [Gemmatimonadales bacterium]
MLRVDLRDLRRGPVPISGEVPPNDPLFDGLDVSLAGPVSVAGDLESAGHGGYYWHGQFEGRVRQVCRRCLTKFESPVDRSVDVLFSADPDLQDDPSVYPLADPITHVDVRPALREELALAVDAFPLCREDCLGLCPRCGANLNEGPCGCVEK